ncbi:MAG: type II secretion system GspH family protein [Lentisphaeraceae bacterium]|nr:type II secretion system GspH family protein [Lentisphaeraceae bacterium]
MKKFTLVELILVVSTIAILCSLLFPALSKAREKAMFSICISHRAQIYKAMFTGVDQNDNYTPVIRDGNWTNSPTPKWNHDDWLGTSRPNGGQLINGVIEEYLPTYKEYLRCPSLPAGEMGDRKGSNGIFDYTFLPALGRMSLYKISTEILWNGRQTATPYVLEENPESINGENRESAFAHTDHLGSWHDYGKKGGYTALDGHSEVLRDHSDTFRAMYMQIEYKGSIKLLNSSNSVERWPRPW